MSNNTTRAITRSDVDVGVPFAPSGNSGISGRYHLHLGVNNGDDNPLRFLRHVNEIYNATDISPVAAIENPPNMHIFTTEELKSSYPIKVTVNTENSFDLDEELAKEA